MKMVRTSETLAKKSIFSKRYRVQILAATTIHIITFTHGIGIGWCSPSLRLLASENTPLNAPLTIEQLSWIGSLIGLGSVFGNIFYGLLLDQIGRKWCMNLIAIPNMLYWILIYTAQNAEYLYVGRFCAGIAGGGVYVVLPIYVSEIVDTSIRGALSSLTMMYVAIGMLVGLILATYLSYYLVPCIAIACPVLFLFAIYDLSETPQFLLRKGKVTEAGQAYRFYKNMSKEAFEPVKVGDEYALRQAEQAEFEDFKAQILKGGSTEKPTFKDFYNKEAAKTFAIILLLMLTNQFSGSFAIFNYTAHIFSELGNDMDPNLSTILVGSSEIIGLILTLFIVDRFGRRLLYISSTVGMGALLSGIGLFKQFATQEFFEKYDWVPLMLLCLVAIIAAIGVIALIFVIIVELLPAKIRSVGTSMSMSLFSCMIFASLKIYPIMLFELGLSMTMYATGCVCFVGAILLGIFLPETKGKSLAH